MEDQISSPTAEQPSTTDVTDRPRRAPRWLFNGQFAVAIAVLVLSFSHPAGDLVMLIYAFWWLLGSAVVWIFLAVRYERAAGRYLRGPVHGFAVAPALLAIAVLVISLGLPLRVRWELSQPSFASAVEAGDWPTSNRVGLYTISHVTQIDDILIFHEEGHAAFGYGGFAYLPDGPSDALEPFYDRISHKHLGGNWYTFSATW